jgi:predicted SprT family Zn-dependent metalloprotease
MGQKIFGGYIVVDIITGFRRRGFRSVVATEDGGNASLSRSCKCTKKTSDVRAQDLVTEAHYTVCGDCRNIKLKKGEQL